MQAFVFISIIIVALQCDVFYSFATSDRDIFDLLRRKRTLTFPPGRETMVQVLFGMGLPMEGDISMTLGYVLKCNYHLPSNSSDFTNGGYVRYVRETNASGNETSGTRRSRSLDGTGPISRWNFYRMLETAMDPRGSHGKACLLRAVCEVAETPFGNPNGGLLGQLLHLILTPSTTNEKYESYSDREYKAAETIGRNSHGRACKSSYRECVYSPLNYFTAIMETLVS